MNKILVLFDSATGNVKQMADLVAEGAALVPDTEVRVLSVGEAKAADVEWCDGIAVGSPTYGCALVEDETILGYRDGRLVDEGGWQDCLCFFQCRRLGWRYGAGLSINPHGADEFRVSGLWRH